MDEVNEATKNILKRVLVNGYIPLDTLSPEERKAIGELLKIGYLRIYVGINGDKLGNLLELLGNTKLALRNPRRNCGKYTLILSLISAPTLYLGIKAFLMGLTDAGLFFIISSGIILIIVYYVVNRWCFSIIRFFNTIYRLIKS